MARSKIVKRIRRDAAYIAIRLFVGSFRALPRHAALALASFFGRLAPYMFRNERRLAIEHLTIAFGEEKSPAEIAMLAHESFRYAALNFADTVRIGIMTADDIRAVCVPHHMERLKEAMAGGMGAIGLTSHAGCWEMLGSFIVADGVDLAVIARRLYDPRLEDMLYRSRSGAGLRVISRGRNTRDVIRALKEGCLLGVLIDQDMPVRGVFVDFFGRTAHTATGLASLALKYSVPVFPVLTYRDTEHRHHICIGEPIPVTRTGDTDRDIAELTALCSKATEDFIREHPEQWVWFHKRWKTRPEDVAAKEKHDAADL